MTGCNKRHRCKSNHGGLSQGKFEGGFVKKKLAVIVAIALTVLTVTMQLFSGVRSIAGNARHVAQHSQPADWIAGPGLIEPISEDIQLDSQLSGKLKSVNVSEGDSVRKGQVLATLENDDYRAELASAAALVEAKEAILRKVTNGARTQEREEAQAEVRETQAVMANAEAELARRRELYQSGVVSREEYERYTREYEVAKERYQEKANHYSLLNASSREEDISLAEADVRLAQATDAEATAKYEKTVIKSPIDGIVLRIHHRSGESVTNSVSIPDPVLTIGDARVLRVRVDIDEADVNKIRVGQRAYVTAEAYGKQKIWGHVVRVSELLGPKKVRTDEPTERVDRKFLETLVELDSGAQLPVGLRVDTFILTDGEETAAVRPRL
jgi:ABC exporter DevB family membrane fusion protein